LADGTKTSYRGIIEPLREKHGTKRVSHLERRHVIALLAKKAETPNAANNLRKRLRQLLDHAIDLGWITHNPAKTVKPYKVPSGGHHAWDEGEISRFFAFHSVGTVPHTSVTLMLYTGTARVDAVKLGWGNVKDGRIEYRRQKTRKSNGVLVSIPIHPRLIEVLETIPRDSFTFLQTAHGKSRSSNGLGNSMRKWCVDAKLPQCSAHGLRKACARRLAEAGATAHEIAAVTGHKTLAEVQRYTEQADRSGMADIALGKMQERSNEQQILAKSK
jgi:integrase